MWQLLVAGAVPIATFDGAKTTTYPWSPVNDPVMGGQSTSSFHVDKDRKLGIWEGEVKIVPFLKAPGFCNLQSPGLYKTAAYPDLSSTTGLVARFDATGLEHYNVMLMSKGSGQKTYTANLSVSAGMADHFVAWSDFQCTYRGQPVPTCPSLHSQLGDIDSISFGTAFPGKAGKFHVEIESISGKDAELALAGAEPLTLATFDDNGHKWTTENDPVMGGQSHASFTPAKALTLPGEFKGVCAVVPKLHAPGFSFIKTESPLSAHFPDVSAYDGLTITGQNVGGNVTDFKLAFCDSRINFFRCQFQVFKAAFTLKAGEKSAFVPFSDFSDKWDSATGLPTAQDPPKAASLRSVTQLQVWVEGTEGDFDLKLASIAATMKPATAVLV